MPPSHLDEEQAAAAELFAAGSLLNKSEEIRDKDIPWGSLPGGADVSAVQQYDSSSDKKVTAEVANGLINILSSVKNPDVVQYVLTMADDAISKLNGDDSTALIAKAPGSYSTLAGLAKSNDAYTSNKSLKVLSSILYQGDDASVSNLLSWLTGQVASPQKETIQSVLYALMAVLGHDKHRVAFFAQPNGVEALSKLLDNNSNFQMQYQVIFCYWLLTYNVAIASKIDPQYHVIKVISGVISKASKEKVIRVSVATLKNLLLKATNAADMAKVMVTHGVPKTLNTLKDKNWKDADLVAELDEVIEELDDLVKDMSSWDEYAAELRTGDLHWSSVHKSEGFWRNCAIKLHENDCEFLKILVSCLDSANPTVQAVATHDIGQYVAHYKNGRRHVENQGGKNKIFTLMANENSSVRYEALSAVQKLLVDNYQAIQVKN